MKKQIGVVGVDSGQLIISDPCYLSNWKDNEFDAPSEPSDMSYSNACKITLNSKDLGGEILFSKGHSGQAVVFCPGFGDGVYPVIAHYKDYGTKEQPDVRIKKVEILLIED